MRKRRPSYRLHRSSGQAVTTICYKDHYLGVYGSDESKAKFNAIMRRWEAGEFHGEAAFDMCPTVKVAVKWFLSEIRAKFSDKPVEVCHYARATKVLLDDPELSNLPADKFSPKRLVACQRALAAKGYVRRQCNRYIRRIRDLFSWLVREDKVSATVTHALREVEAIRAGEFGAREHDEVLPVPEDDLARTLARLQRIPRAMADLQLLTGMRPGEVVQLRPCDIVKDGKFEIAPGFPCNLGDCWLYRPAKHKTQYKRHHRLVLIGPSAQRVLAPYLDRATLSPCFSPREATEEFMASVGRTMNPDRKRMPGNSYLVSSYYHAITKACKRAEVTPWHPHQLRHNAGSRIGAEFGPEVARIVLGHKTFAATRIYLLDDMAKAVSAVGKAG